MLAYAFTWLVLLPVYFVRPLPVPLLAFVAVAQFGPSLAAFALTIGSDVVVWWASRSQRRTAPGRALSAR